MASYLFTAEQAATSALSALSTLPVFAQTISRDYSRDFVAGTGGRVAITRPTIVDDAKVYTDALRAAEAPIEYSEFLQPAVGVELTDQVYNAVKLDDAVSTFSLTDLEGQVIAPMGQSIADKIESIAYTVLDDVPAGLSAVDTAEKGTLVHADGTVFDSVNDYLAADPKARNLLGTGRGLSADQAAVYEDRLTAASDGVNDLLAAVMAAKQVLDKRGVAPAGRTLLVGTDWEFAFATSDKFTNADTSGSANGLRNATIAKVFGFNVVVSSEIDPAAAYAYARDFATLVTAVTAPPRGAAFSAVKSAGGYSLRYLHDYDSTTLRDRAIVDTFAGVELLDAQRVLKLSIEGATPAA